MIVEDIGGIAQVFDDEKLFEVTIYKPFVTCSNWPMYATVEWRSYLRPTVKDAKIYAELLLFAVKEAESLNEEFKKVMEESLGKLWEESN